MFKFATRAGMTRLWIANYRLETYARRCLLVVISKIQLYGASKLLYARAMLYNSME